jgi:type VI secretion system protein ImpC
MATEAPPDAPPSQAAPPAAKPGEGVARPAPGAPPGRPRPAPPVVDAVTPQEPSLFDQIMALARIPEASPDHTLVRQGLMAFVAFVNKLGGTAEMVDRAGVDLLIAELTDRLSRQVDEILHHTQFQQLEAAWRGLKFVIDRVDFRENIRVELLNVSKRDLFDDFQDSPEIPKSGLYRLVYSTEFGQFGGKPQGLLVANYEFAPTPQDMALLADCGAVATMAHAPFIAGADSKFFGLDDYLKLPNLAELRAIFQGPQYTKWQALRDSSDSRYVGLCMPRFLLRLPYGSAKARVQAFEYGEDVVGHHHRYLWGNAAFAFATRVADAFARYRWCLNIIGPQSGGTVEDLPLHEYDALGRIETKVPTEVVITERREHELAEEGFIALTYRAETKNACFFSASSVQKARTFARTKEGREAELNYRLGTQLQYLFVVCRLAHYIKVIQREHIGSWKERQDLERELQAWLRQYVAEQEVVAASVRAKRPLRRGKVSVSEVEGNAGWYKVDIQVQPHFRFMGTVFHLDVVGRLDKE